MGNMNMMVSTATDVHVMAALIHLLCDEEVAGTLSNVFCTSGGGARGASEGPSNGMEVDCIESLAKETPIPLARLVQFKRLQSYSLQHIVHAVSCLGGQLFALSPDGECIQRRTSFAKTPTLHALADSLHSKRLLVSSIPAEARELEVEHALSRAGGCDAALIMKLPCRGKLPKTMMVRVADMAAYLRLLALERAPLLLGDGEAACVVLSYPPFDPVADDPQAAAASLPNSQAPRLIPGKVLEFQCPGLLQACAPSTYIATQEAVKRVFEAYAVVASVELPPHIVKSDEGCDAEILLCRGRVVFRAANAAAKVLQLAHHHGGLKLNGEALECRALTGEEEATYWRVRAVREANVSPAERARRQAVANVLNASKSRLVQRQGRPVKVLKGRGAANAVVFRGPAGQRTTSGSGVTKTKGKPVAMSAGKRPSQAAAGLRKTLAARSSTIAAGDATGKRRVAVDPLRDLLSDMLLDSPASSTGS
jgi:hypothetical protein